MWEGQHSGRCSRRSDVPSSPTWQLTWHPSDRSPARRVAGPGHPLAPRASLPPAPGPSPATPGPSSSAHFAELPPPCLALPSLPLPDVASSPHSSLLSRSFRLHLTRHASHRKLASPPPSPFFTSSQTVPCSVRFTSPTAIKGFQGLHRLLLSSRELPGLARSCLIFLSCCFVGFGGKKQFRKEKRKSKSYGVVLVSGHPGERTGRSSGDVVVSIVCIHHGHRVSIQGG